MDRSKITAIPTHIELQRLVKSFGRPKTKLRISATTRATTTDGVLFRQQEGIEIYGANNMRATIFSGDVVAIHEGTLEVIPFLTQMTKNAFGWDGLKHLMGLFCQMDEAHWPEQFIFNLDWHLSNLGYAKGGSYFWSEQRNKAREVLALLCAIEITCLPSEPVKGSCVTAFKLFNIMTKYGRLIDIPIRLGGGKLIKVLVPTFNEMELAVNSMLVHGLRSKERKQFAFQARQLAQEPAGLIHGFGFMIPAKLRMQMKRDRSLPDLRLSPASFIRMLGLPAEGKHIGRDLDSARRALMTMAVNDYGVCNFREDQGRDGKALWRLTPSEWFREILSSGSPSALSHQTGVKP